MQGFHDLVNWANGYLWGAPMLVLLFGTHVFLTLRLKFIQKYVCKAIKLSVSKDRSGDGDVSQFGALTTALAATIGTGNIVGVATAVGLGGPGAVLWCWLTGVFGMATKYSEALLSVRYRVKTSDGTMLGGPMYALENGLNMKWLAVLFCIFTSVAAFGIGNMVQANSISVMLQETMGINPYFSGGILAVLTAVVILGGVKSIASVCEKLVPFMAVFYVLGCAIILVMNASYLPATISLIIQSAFTPQAAGSGFIGASVMMAMRYGIARGLFSNESGLGSAPIVAAAAQTKNPVRQALVSMTGTFWDTVVVCAMTGLVLVSSVIEDPAGLNQLSGAALTKGAFAQIPVIGPIVLSVGLLTFVFSTILGWSYYGERAVEYLFGKKSIRPYRIVWVIAVFLGSVTSLTLVWDLADAMNAMMAIPNLVSLIALSGVIVADTKRYLWEEGGLEREATEQYVKERK
ncbi:alanine/glycine:cation symporter family protein [Sporomusa acidovorans]|uniref:Amino-acid carrier protein AlsT n=1 Tax=Sporomusa acidovorans (strain ATCC 49682 / DSM 3132 / Mol) TaxID=1123286 RepID=A0ABZ3IVL8_SPOA4|nr:alanine/glycine:cation symporter family protein [Sporomusa acidovorans]OZC15243.1 amino-acid carrier protein AlsT [Sporomusa acidovorans DSM 3132]SDE90971.1 alanine or glycine:cation symporter, AGCS family [Sporomusa acidovorans]